MGIDDDVLLRILLQRQLLIGVAEIDLREEFSVAQPCKQILDFRNWVSIQL